MTPTTEPRATPANRSRSRGQIAVIFAGSILLFTALCAVVVDVSFYWVNTLRVQRAADAAALAGAVYLPGDPATAYSAAAASAKQNGYGLTVGCQVAKPTTPSSVPGMCAVQDPSDARQLDVQISTNVGTFFARVIGITSWPVSRLAKGVYVLPVPMGSPLAYYGVGSFTANITTTTPYTSTSLPGYTSVSGGQWITPDQAWLTGSTGNNALTANANTTGQAQQWRALHIPAVAGSQLDGIVVAFNAKVTTAAASCQVQAQISWDDGSTWSNAPLTTGNLTSTNNVGYPLGSTTALSVWGSNLPSASTLKSALSNDKFQVRLTWLEGSGCGNLRLNTLLVTAFSHTDSTALTTTAGVNDGVTFLASQGAWGAVLTKGGNQQNGDAYSPANNGGYSPSNNVKYDPSGYDYLLQLPSGGTVKVFDPGFCAMGGNGAAGSLGAGDHWIGSSGTPVSTYYTLWNTNGKPGLPSTWTPLYTSGTLFEDLNGYDPVNGSNPGGATSGCDPAWHNTWWTVPVAVPAGGPFALQVQTTKTDIVDPVTHASLQAADDTKNQSTNAENMWAIEAVGASAQVYGNGRMAVYNNLLGGTQQFYLAKIDQATGAGKTAIIDLFDPGDLGSGANGTLQVLSPDGGTPHTVNFSYTTDSNCSPKSGTSPCSGTNVNQIITTWNGASATNNTWIHISIPMGSTYGQGGLWQGGWWQIQYIVGGGAGNDTTTWQVSVQGNPVHLLVP